MLFEYASHQRALLRTVDDFGFVSYDLVGYPRRLCDPDGGPPLVDANVDKRRVNVLPTPAAAAEKRVLADGDGWLSYTSRTLARLYAAFLVAEDPQRRLDASKAATLMHQVSLVQHILGQPNLRKVLIGDEVGLGKTIEAGLIIRQLIERDSRARVLYLAPARLVSNVAREFREKLDLDARVWAAGNMSDARLAEDPQLLAELLREGIGLIRSGAAQTKWQTLCNLIDRFNDEKVVLFAQPVETVTVVAEYLAKRYGVKPALIIGSQTDDERTAQVSRFQSDDGARFLVSSKAGGEGLNMQRARHLIHLDVPWNPMDLEQRIGRVHRFGSRKTIKVDTVVAAGSREVDMYRIARDKLAMAVRHLDPEQFEGLFSRVMSLVPPKELETILGDATGPLLFNSYAAEEIGRLVTEGFKLWSDFDQKYRRQAETIRAINPGQATWADLGSFLVRYGGATDGPGAKFSSFEFSKDEIVEIEQSLPTVLLDGKRFACGDTGGLPAIADDGASADRLGINLQWVQRCLRDAFAPGRGCGVAFIKSPPWLPTGSAGETVVCYFVFLRQKLQQEGGRWVEVGVEMKLFQINPSDEPQLVAAEEAARMVRSFVTAARIREPQKLGLRTDLIEIERGLYSQLRQPSDDEIHAGLRYAAWPLGLVVAS